MNKPTVYIETTIPSYLTAWPSRDVIRLSHEMLTRQWWNTSRFFFDLYVSDAVIAEVSRGDPIAAKERLEKLVDIPVLRGLASADALAAQLATVLKLPVKAQLDAAHLAIAAIHGINFLLTWNCTHLANGMFADKIESTCASAGFKSPRILTPGQLMEVQ